MIFVLSILVNNRFDLFLLHELDHFTTDFTTGVQSKEYKNNGKKQLSTIIFWTMWRGHTTMSLSNLLQELHIFTTQVKTNNVPALSYSTSTLLVVIKSLRYNIIPFHHLLLFCFVFYCTRTQVFYCTNSMKNQTKKIKISRNFLWVKMVSENMKSLPMMHIIGWKV